MKTIVITPVTFLLCLTVEVLYTNYYQTTSCADKSENCPVASIDNKVINIHSQNKRIITASINQYSNMKNSLMNKSNLHEESSKNLKNITYTDENAFFTKFDMTRTISSSFCNGTTLGLFCTDSISLSDFFEQDSLYFFYNGDKNIFEIVSFNLVVVYSKPFRSKSLFFKNNGNIIPKYQKEKISRKRNISMIGFETVIYKEKGTTSFRAFYGNSKFYYIKEECQ